MDDETAAAIIRSIGLGPSALTSSSSGKSGTSSWNRLFFWFDLRHSKSRWWYALRWATSSSTSGPSNAEVTKLEAEREEYQRHFAEMWNENNLDIIICPGKSFHFY